jgi:hypothetical protein
MKAISVSGSAAGFQRATASMWSLPTVMPPSSCRSRFSSRIFIE